MLLADILLLPAEVYPRLIREDVSGDLYVILAGASGATASLAGASLAQGALADTSIQPADPRLTDARPILDGTYEDPNIIIDGGLL